MPVHKAPETTNGGNIGKIYLTKAQAEVQGRAIYASGYKEKPTNKKK